MKHLFLAALSLILLGIGCQNSLPTALNTEQIADNTKRFCSPDGTLTEQPTKQGFYAYCIVPQNELSITPGTPTNYSFTIVNNEGNTVKEFSITHEKLIHVVIVSEDLQEFQHLHPVLNKKTSVFTLENLTLPTDGTYYLYANFIAPDNMQNPEERATVLATHTLTVGEKTPQQPQPLQRDLADKIIDTFEIHLQKDGGPASPIFAQEETNLTLTVYKETPEQPAPLESYLGELGHLVVIQEQTHTYIHAHPIRTDETSQVHFTVPFPEAGTYKLFFEFQVDGVVRMVSYVVEVDANTSQNNEPKDAMVDHHGHE